MDTPLQQNICRTLQYCRTMLKYCFVFHRGTRASRGHQDHLSMLTHQKTFTSKESRWRFFFNLFLWFLRAAQSLNFCTAVTVVFCGWFLGFVFFCFFFRSTLVSFIWKEFSCFYFCCLIFFYFFLFF